jgi:hypothetical protein
VGGSAGDALVADAANPALMQRGIMPSGRLPSLPDLLIRSAATLLRSGMPGLPEAGMLRYFEIAGIDQVQVAKYRQLFGNQGNAIPLGYFYVLSQRAQLALLLDEQFPFPIPGLIHTRNALQLHGTVRGNAGLAVSVSVLPNQGVGGAPGIVCHVEMRQSGQLVVSCISAYRIPRKGAKKREIQRPPECLPPWYVQSDWLFRRSDSWRYARVSGDYNLIHLSRLLARAFGFKGAIAHGMYSVGRAVASIESRTTRQLIAIDADFLHPIPLPARAAFGFGPADTGQGGYGVLLPDRARLALSGTWESG